MTLAMQGETPDGRTAFSHDLMKLQLVPGEPGMVGYLAPKYVLSDRHTAFANGAFRKTAEEQLSRAHHLFQHWPDLTIGKHTAAEEDRTGFRVTVVINEDKQLGKDVMSDYRFGIPYGWSIGFDPMKDRTATDEDFARLDLSGVPDSHLLKASDVRMITEARWWEGSTVTWGAIHTARPDVIQRRQPGKADIGLLIAAVRDGTLTDELSAQLDDLIEAWQAARAAAGERHSTPPEPSQDQYAAQLDLLLFELGVTTEQAA